MQTASMKRESSPARLPVAFKSAVELTAAQGQDGVGPPHSPEHARQLASRANHSLASSLDNTRPHKQVLSAKLGVSHALGVFFEVLCLSPDHLRLFGVGCLRGSHSGHQGFDLSLVEQGLMDHDPSVLV